MTTSRRRSTWRRMPGVAFCVACVSAHAAPGPSTQDVVRYFETLEASARSIQTTFTATNLEPREVDVDSSWPSAGWESSPAISQFRYDWATHGGRVRIECSYQSEIGIDPGFRAMERTTDVWTGSVWYRRTVARDPDTGEPLNNYNIEKRPRMTPPADCLSLFNGGIEWISIVGAYPLSRIAETYTFEGQTAEGEDRISLQYSAPSYGAERVSFLFETVPKIRLVSVSRVITSNDGSIALKAVFYIDEWGEYDGIQLPRRARRIGAILGSRRATCTVYDRETAHVLSTSDEGGPLFDAPPVEIGDVVIDETRRLNYEIGTRHVELEGVGFDLDEPVLERITDLPALKLRLTGEGVSPCASESTTHVRFRIDHGPCP